MEAVSEARMNAYKALLARHDWSYAMSDDYSAAKQGADVMGRLDSERRHIDPDYSVWNSIAPVGHRKVKR